MDNLTHSLVGLAASKAGLERVSPGATLLCVLAANAPDSDIVVLLFGDRWTFLQHHRGITHSIVGTIVLGLTLPLIFCALERLIARLRRRQPTFSLKGLIFASLIVSATHPLMDWTNNYGIRPLLPLSSQWFYGDFVFIVDPFMWLVFGGACFLLTAKTKLQIAFWLLLATLLSYVVLVVPLQRGLEHAIVLQVCWVLTLAALVISFKLRAAQRCGHKLALAGFAVVVLYSASLAVFHWFALRDARLQARTIASQNSENVTDVAAMPSLANPFQWLCVVETERAAYRFELSLAGRQGAVSDLVRHERADISNSPAVVHASSDRRARIFLDFARFPVARVMGQDCMTQTLVQFADLRYTEPGTSRGTFSLEVPVECPSEIVEEEN